LKTSFIVLIDVPFAFKYKNSFDKEFCLQGRIKLGAGSDPKRLCFKGEGAKCPPRQIYEDMKEQMSAIAKKVANVRGATVLMVGGCPFIILEQTSSLVTCFL
jgi:hypothetical protein